MHKIIRINEIKKRDGAPQHWKKWADEHQNIREAVSSEKKKKSFRLTFFFLWFKIKYMLTSNEWSN